MRLTSLSCKTHNAHSNSTYFPEEVVGGGSIIVPHCHLQRLFLQLNGKKGEEDKRRETVMAEPVGACAHGVHLYAASVLICIRDVGSTKQLWHATIVWKTTRRQEGRPCCTLHASLAALTGSIAHPCMCLGIRWGKWKYLPIVLLQYYDF